MSQRTAILGVVAEQTCDPSWNHGSLVMGISDCHSTVRVGDTEIGTVTSAMGGGGGVLVHLHTGHAFYFSAESLFDAVLKHIGVTNEDLVAAAEQKR